MSKRLIILLLALSIGLNIGVIGTTLVQRARVDRRPPPPRDEQGPPADPQRLVEDHLQGITLHLNLDAEQQGAIRALLERHAPELVALRQELAESRRRLTKAYAAPAFDPESFRRLATESSRIRTRLDSLSAVMLVGEAAILTTPQRVLFSEVAPSVHDNPQGGPRQGGPPPPDGARPPRPH